MRKRYTEEQVIAVLNESRAEAKTGELVRRHGISRQTFYRWRQKYGGMHVDEAKRPGGSGDGLSITNTMGAQKQ